MEKVSISISAKLTDLSPKAQRAILISVGVVTRETIYNELTVQFFGITRELSDEKKLELDGLLWDLALRLVETL